MRNLLLLGAVVYVSVLIGLSITGNLSVGTILYGRNFGMMFLIVGAADVVRKKWIMLQEVTTAIKES